MMKKEEKKILKVIQLRLVLTCMQLQTTNNNNKNHIERS